MKNKFLKKAVCLGLSGALFAGMFGSLFFCQNFAEKASDKKAEAFDMIEKAEEFKSKIDFVESVLQDAEFDYEKAVESANNGSASEEDVSVAQRKLNDAKKVCEEMKEIYFSNEFKENLIKNLPKDEPCVKSFEEANTLEKYAKVFSGVTMAFGISGACVFASQNFEKDEKKGRELN